MYSSLPCSPSHALTLVEELHSISHPHLTITASFFTPGQCKQRCTLQRAGTHHQQEQRSVQWLVQLSDLHISKWTDLDIVPDLEAFGTNVLAALQPGALLITGDLVDSKTRQGGSEQQEEEWLAYSKAWQRMAASADLASSQVLDVRGNHDTFDSVRAKPTDFFTLHSAMASALGR